MEFRQAEPRWRWQTGASAVEYLVLLGALAFVILVGAAFLGFQFPSVFGSVSGRIASSSEVSPGSSPAQPPGQGNPGLGPPQEPPGPGRPGNCPPRGNNPNCRP
jgi:Flp pilus assembly pilin Flp